MDNSFRQDDSNVQQPASFSVSLPVVSNFFKWLASQIEPTKEEQEDAGVYLGGEGRD
jgi:hypothetical protein